jgi:hypothetical protein
MSERTCDCQCHGYGSAHNPGCDVPGGCGHLHRDEGPDCSDHRTPAQPHCVLPHRAWPDGCERLATANDGLACHWHRQQLDHLLGEIKQLDEELDLIAVAGTAPKESTGKAGRTKNPSPPAPANLDVLVLRDARSHGDVDCEDDRRGQPWSVPYLTEVYCARLRDERPLTRIVLRPVRNRITDVAYDIPTTVPALVPRSSAARLDMLIRHHDWITGQSWLDDYWDEMVGLRKAMRTALRDRPITKSLGSCYLLVGEDPCTGRLVQDNGSDVVRCTNRECESRWVTAQELATLEVAMDSQRARHALPVRPSSRVAASRQGNGWMAS